MTKRETSIWRLLFTSSFLYLLCVALALFIILYDFTTSQREVQSQEAIHRSLDVLTPSLIREAWNIDSNGIEIILTSISAHEHVAWARYFDEQLDLSAPQPEPGEPERGTETCDLLISRDISRDQMASSVLPSGNVDVCYVSENTFFSFAETLLIAGLPITLVVALSAMGPAIITKRLILDPVRQLTDQLKSSTGALDEVFVRRDGRKGDEIDLLYQGLNSRSASIRHEREIFQRAFDYMIDGLAVCGEDYEILRANPAFREAAKDITGETTHEDVRSIFSNSIIHARDKLIEIPGDNNSVYEVSSRRVKFRENESLFFFVVRNKTHEKRLEKERIQTQKMIALGTLSGGVAHDFNNILAVILGGAELLEVDSIARTEKDKIIHEIISASNLGKSITRQLLTYARRSELKTEDCSIMELVESVIAMSRRVIGSQYLIELKSVHDAAVRVDRSGFESSMLNLILNARDALPHGGSIRIRVSQGVEEANDPGMVSILVSNNFEKLSDTFIDRITEPFFTTKGEGKGTGLGLSMVSGFIEQSGGKISIFSDEVEGFCVRISLPTVGQGHEVVGTSTPVGAIGSADDLKKRILVVDDMDNVRQILSLMISRLGHTAVEASNIVEVESIIEKDKDFDLVICDFALKEATAFEVVEVLQRANVRLPFYVVSGHIIDSAVDELKAAGVTEVLNKPLRLKDLKSIIGSSARRELAE